MKLWFTAGMCLAMIGLLALPSPALAQKKTVKACQEEWRANKADNQAKGITEKAYVTQCRAGGVSAQPASTPTAPPSPTPSAARPAAVKTAKVCQDEWRAKKADYQAAKITERAYVEKCRAGEAVALPTTPAATPTPTPTAAAPPPKPAGPVQAPASAPAVKPSPAVAKPPTGVDEYQTEAQAKSHWR